MVKTGMFLVTPVDLFSSSRVGRFMVLTTFVPPHLQRLQAEPDAAQDMEALQDEAEDEFLLLDDVVKEGRNIDLVERREDVIASAALAAGIQQQQQLGGEECPAPRYLS
jgi:hypothetical protein